MYNPWSNSNGQFSGVRVWLRRRWREGQHWFWYIIERPAFRVSMFIAMLALLATFLLHYVELNYAVDQQGQLRGEDGPYGTLLETIHNVTILFLSGFDTERPDTEIGFVLAVICLGLGVTVFTFVAGDLISIAVAATIKAKSRRRVRAKNHIVICGWHHTAQALVQQLISRERKPRREIVVVDEDTDEIAVYDPDVHHVQGDPTDMDVLTRANTAKAHTAIIPIDWKLSEELQDSRTALAAMAVRALNEGIYTCVEVLHSHNKRHIERIGVDEVVCVGDFSKRVISSAVVANGTSRLLADILTFNQGSEIYRVELPDALAGRSFRWLLAQLNQRAAAILLSVQRGGQTYTNPQGEFLFEAGDKLFILSEHYPEQLEDLNT